MKKLICMAFCFCITSVNATVIKFDDVNAGTGSFEESGYDLSLDRFGLEGSAGVQLQNQYNSLLTVTSSNNSLFNFDSIFIERSSISLQGPTRDDNSLERKVTVNGFLNNVLVATDIFRVRGYELRSFSAINLQGINVDSIEVSGDASFSRGGRGPSRPLPGTTSFDNLAVTQVSAPSALAILALGLMGLASRRFKKQS